jgi:hypothetical protein
MEIHHFLFMIHAILWSFIPFKDFRFSVNRLELMKIQSSLSFLTQNILP